MNQVKVSVIVPVYNVEVYLSQCLDSLLNQTLQEIEIIVVNDGSLDNSQQIMEEYAATYPEKIRIFKKQNGGLSDTRNFGVTKASGEYIGFVDSDDFTDKEMFSSLYKKAVEEDADVVVCNYYTYQNGKIKPIMNIVNPGEPTSVEENPEVLLCCKSLAVNKLYRREWYVDNGFEFPTRQLYEDSAVVYNMLYRANRVALMDECFYYYRKDREDSITNTVTERVFDIFKSCKSIVDFYYPLAGRKAFMDVVQRVCQIHLLVRLDEVVKWGDVKLRIRYYRAMIAFLKKYMPEWKRNPFYAKKKKKTLVDKLRDKPGLMYCYLLIPIRLKKLLKKQRRKEEPVSYINNERLRELQLFELEILKKIDEIAKQENITYYLGEGSLLGAMRHHGFIPWDDDLDILMPREDYNRFLAVAPNLLGEKLVLLNRSIQNSYYLPFSKVVSLDKKGFINRKGKHAEAHQGPFVDIFPLDYYDTNDPVKVEKHYRRIRKLRDMLLLKAKVIGANTKRRKVYRQEAKLFSYEQIHSKLHKLMTQCNSSGPYMCNFASSYHPSRQIVPKEVYGQPRYVRFEDGEFPVPQDAHRLLTTIYGDYMKFPPVAARKGKHELYDEVSEANIYLTKPAEDEAMNQAVLEEVRSLQMYELDILKEVDRVCKKNEITYYLGEGTLLGAIRHKGFIPWDDDIDILMPREEWIRFRKACEKELNPGYKIQFYDNVEQYWVQSPKVRMLAETEFKQRKLKNYTKDIGPYIDIFILDYSPGDLKEEERRDRIIKRFRRLIFLKTGFSKPKNWKQKIAKILLKFVKTQTIHKWIEKVATKYNCKENAYYCNFGSYYPIRKEMIPVSSFGEPKYVEFEGCMLPVPQEADAVLTTIYGDYMKLPPKEKQVAKHSFG